MTKNPIQNLRSELKRYYKYIEQMYEKSTDSMNQRYFKGQLEAITYILSHLMKTGRQPPIYKDFKSKNNHRFIVILNSKLNKIQLNHLLKLCSDDIDIIDIKYGSDF